MKALIMTVGTGVGKGKITNESLSKALAFSITQHNPDATFFVTSAESKQTAERVIKKSGVQQYEIITIENPDDIQNIYETLEPKFKQVTQSYQQVTVDYTSGTKPMSAAVAILGTLYEANTLSYLTGKRENGTIKAGTEQPKIIRPYFVTAEKKRQTAIQLFNKNQFNATITIINQIEKTTSDTTVISKTQQLKKLASAYAEWDKFKHQTAFNILRKINMPELRLNKKFLGQLLKSEQPEPFYIADLINNAKRRGIEEQKYDDATARLYRTVELIAQHRLKNKYGIQTIKVDTTQLPEELKQEWQINQLTPPIKIGLEKAYRLLEAKNDMIGKKFTKDNELKNLLIKRNTSILAHGITPVDRQTYIQLYKKILDYAQQTTPNLTELIEESKFIKLKNSN
ncbi:MAG: TIGR02710 family CRISPR-associated CARF protein [Candidatus Bathyarchaeota archaeon]|nr:TIGR02710 family CRISPR-associated CARF protein [Candidatus Bathyarchaeota archaeon]